ncbi:MAG: transporter substrate-binding domain-containing protein [Actinomycetota bacterium]
MFLRWRAALVCLVLGLLLALASPGAAQSTDEDADQTTGETLTVATKSLPPLVSIGEDGELSGFSIDYWEEVASRLGVGTTWVIEQEVSDLIAATEAGEVDAAIAGISITREREAVIDFSQPYYISGQQIVTTPGGAGTFGTLGSLIGSGTFLVPLIVLVVLVILVSHLVWWFERGHDSDDFPYEYRAGIGEALWWSTVSVITGGEAVKNINTALSRLIAVFWMLVGLFLLAFVTARATSVLTVAELESDISGLDDLAGRPVATVQQTASVAFLRDEAGVIAREEPDLDAALAALLSGDVDAVVFDAPVVAFSVNESYKGDLILVEPVAGRDP